MRLWRLSGSRHARAFDGGYGLFNNGRWNTRGRPVTYCSTVPSLAALEKRVHVTEARLLPPQIMIEYDVPDDVAVRAITIAELPSDWRTRETMTQRLGDGWADAASDAILIVPSVIMPLPHAPDRNAVINHRHPSATRITIVSVTPLTLDPRLFAAA
jgi:RES domain-containing protein